MMSSKDRVEDVSFLLFMVPFIVSAAYALYLWISAGLSADLPSPVFLQVTESPYVFLIGFVAVIGGIVLDVRAEDPSARRQKLIKESGRIQTLAVVALVLAALCAWYSAGFDPGVAATNLLAGRYAVIFPVILVVFSFLMLPAVDLKPKQSQYLILIVFILVIPVAIDEVGKRDYFAGMFIAVAMLILAGYTYFRLQQGSGTPSRTGSGK